MESIASELETLTFDVVHWFDRVLINADDNVGITAAGLHSSEAANPAVDRSIHPDRSSTPCLSVSSLGELKTTLRKLQGIFSPLLTLLSTGQPLLTPRDNAMILHSLWILFCRLPTKQTPSSHDTLRFLDLDLCQAILNEASKCFVLLPPSLSSHNDHEMATRPPDQVMGPTGTNVLFWHVERLQYRMLQEYSSTTSSSPTGVFRPDGNGWCSQTNTSVRRLQDSHDHEQQLLLEQRQDDNQWFVMVLNHCYCNSFLMTTVPTGFPDTAEPEEPQQSIPVLLLQRLLPDCIHSARMEPLSRTCAHDYYMLLSHLIDQVVEQSCRALAGESLINKENQVVSSPSSNGMMLVDQETPHRWSSLPEWLLHQLSPKTVSQGIGDSPDNCHANDNNSLVSSWQPPVLLSQQQQQRDGWMNKPFRHARQTQEDEQEEQERTLGLFVELLTDFAVLTGDMALEQIHFANQRIQLLRNKTNNTNSNKKKKKMPDTAIVAEAPRYTESPPKRHKVDDTSSIQRTRNLPRNPYSCDRDSRTVAPSETTSDNHHNNDNDTLFQNKDNDNHSNTGESRSDDERTNDENHKTVPNWTFPQVVHSTLRLVVVAVSVLEPLQKWNLEGLDSKGMLTQLWRALAHGLVYSSHAVYPQDHDQTKTNEDQDTNNQKDEHENQRQDSDDQARYRIASLLWRLTNTVLWTHVGSLFEEDVSKNQQHHQWLLQEQATLGMVSVRLLRYSTSLTERFGHNRLWSVLRHIIVDWTNSHDPRSMSAVGGDGCTVSSIRRGGSTSTDGGGNTSAPHLPTFYCKQTTMARYLQTVLQSALMDWAKRFRKAKLLAAAASDPSLAYIDNHNNNGIIANDRECFLTHRTHPVVDEMLLVATAPSVMSEEEEETILGRPRPDHLCHHEAFLQGFQSTWNRILHH